MPIDKSLRPDSFDFDVIDGELQTFDDQGMGGVEVAIEDAVATEDEDGGITVDFGEGEDEVSEAGFTDNLAEFMDESELGTLATDLRSRFDADKTSRKEWEMMYKKGIDLLGLKIEERTEPWVGACGVFHPMLAEAVVRFQSQTIGEIFPAKGPVKTKVVGKWSEDLGKQAKRVQNHMNYVITEEMTDYRRETERLLWSLPIAGNAFRKTYLHPVRKVPESMFVPAEDLVVNYAEASLEKAERITHIMKMSPNDVLRTQATGFWRDIDIPAPTPEKDAIKDVKNKLQGVTESWLDIDQRHQILEMHVFLDLVGFEEDVPVPFVVTFDHSSNTILSIRRNWLEEDEAMERVQHFTHYEYIPGFGLYAFGLTHLIGSLVQGSTSILRQLIDSGSLANLPGGLKTRGLRVKGDETPIMPGEWRDVDVPSGTVRDNIMPLPYKEPSATLLALLGQIVEDGRRFASMADMKIADMNQEAPVGTTLAIMERALKVQTAVQQRIHDTLKKEFKILARIIKDNEPSYPYEVEEGEDIAIEDYSDRVDIIPVSDPNASTFSQRVMQYQATLQLSQTAPEIYDKKLLHRQMIEAMGLDDVDRLIPNDEDIESMDPVVENMAMLNMKPVKAKEYQDHEAHLVVHRTMKGDPSIQQGFQNSPSGNAVMAAIDAHEREHMAYQYRREIERELGVSLPPEEDTLPEDIEKRLSSTLAAAAEQLSGKKQAMAQAEQNAAQQQDPIIQMQQKELQLQEGELQRKIQADKDRKEIEQQKIQAGLMTDGKKIEIKQQEVQADLMTEGKKLELKKQEILMDSQSKSVRDDATSTLESIRLGAQIAKDSSEKPKGKE